MAIANVNSGVSGIAFGAVTISSFNAGTAADTCVLVFATYNYLAGPGTFSTCTFAGNSMTKLSSHTDSNGNECCIFYWIGTGTTGNIVTATDDSNDRKSILAVAFSGVASVVGNGTDSGSAGDPPTFSATIPSQADSTAVACVWTGDPGSGTRVTGGSGVTELFDADTTDHSFWCATKAGATTSVEIDGTFASSYHDWRSLGLSLVPASGATLDQDGFRFGLDDGAENAHTWAAAADTNITAAGGETRLLNFVINATGAPGAKVFKLQYRKVGDPTWLDMPLQ